MRAFLTCLVVGFVGLSSGTCAAAELRLTADRSVILLDKTTTEKLDVLADSPNEICFLNATVQEASEIILRLLRNTRLIDKNGAAIPSYDKSGEEFTTEVKVGLTENSVRVKVVYEYANRAGYNLSLNILACPD